MIYLTKEKVTQGNRYKQMVLSY